jgi:hypothetical protein
MFHLKGNLTTDNVGRLITMVEVDQMTPPMMKPSLGPRMGDDINVVIRMDGMGVEMLGKLTYGKEVIASVAQIERPIEKGMNDVGPMVLREGILDIKGMPLVHLNMLLMDHIRETKNLV